MESRQQAEEIVRTVLLDAGCDFMAEDSVKFVAAKIDAKDATIARLEAEAKKWKAAHDEMARRNRELRDRPDLGDRAKSIDDLRSTIARLEAEVAGLRARLGLQ